MTDLDAIRQRTDELEGMDDISFQIPDVVADLRTLLAEVERLRAEALDCEEPSCHVRP